MRDESHLKFLPDVDWGALSPTTRPHRRGGYHGRTGDGGSEWELHRSSRSSRGGVPSEQVSACEIGGVRACLGSQWRRVVAKRQRANSEIGAGDQNRDAQFEVPQVRSKRWTSSFSSDVAVRNSDEGWSSTCLVTVSSVRLRVHLCGPSLPPSQWSLSTSDERV